MEARYQILSNLGFDANYSYLYTNQPIEAAPSNKFYAGATYSPGRFTFNLNVQSISGLYIRVDNKDASNNLKENYTLLNARAAYRFGTEQKGLNLFVKGENLTAARYQINFGYPMPKAVFMGGVEVTF